MNSYRVLQKQVKGGPRPHSGDIQNKDDRSPFLLDRNTGFYENSGFQNVQNEDEYEEVVSKSDDLFVSDTQQEQTSKTYESLGTKNAVDVYDDLNNLKGPPSSKPSVDHYEALRAKDKPNLYEKLENQQGNFLSLRNNNMLDVTITNHLPSNS
ncbi:Hypothetical predicted protein [Mytilus galloprovincialis]|uniref:Uncharacterized protein n=1 Tax=Mytilus galloprovincialis TaxID=29158 RepID=A0A8B6EY01_MYTGA|nr:Hypothetical predicted protein [Mytilus galloprovincialis]